MKYYRKQPVEAIQWSGDDQMEVSDFVQKVTRTFATKDDGYGNLHVCYMDSKKREHQAIIPKFGWVVIEGKTLQFYKDETFRKTFKPVAESASEALWPDTQELVNKFDKAFDDCMFKGFHGVPKKKIQEAVDKKFSGSALGSEGGGSDQFDDFYLEQKKRLADGKSSEAAESLIKRIMQMGHISRDEAVDKLCDGLEESLLGGNVSDNVMRVKMSAEKDVESVTFDSVLDEMKELHAKKNKDYKGSFHDLFKEYGMPYALGHLEEKLNRVKAITANGGNAVKNDHIEDSVIDLASYAVMLYVELKNQKK